MCQNTDNIFAKHGVPQTEIQILHKAASTLNHTAGAHDVIPLTLAFTLPDPVLISVEMHVENLQNLFTDCTGNEHEIKRSFSDLKDLSNTHRVGTWHQNILNDIHDLLFNNYQQLVKNSSPALNR